MTGTMLGRDDRTIDSGWGSVVDDLADETGSICGSMGIESFLQTAAEDGMFTVLEASGMERSMKTL